MREKGVAFDLVAENFWERRVRFLAINPACEVPVLIEADGKAIVESYAICEYLEEAYPERKLLGDTIGERAEVRRITGWFDVKFNHEVTRNIVYEKYYKRLMGYGPPSSASIRAGKANIVYHLEYIAYLLKGRPWLAGEQMTLADISAAAHLSTLDYFGDVDWSMQPAAKEWYALIKSRPSFRPLLSDRIPGVNPPQIYEDLDF